MTDKILDSIEEGVYDGEEYVRIKTIPIGSVIDEEKSVRWNREEVELLNNKNLEQRDRYRRSVDGGIKDFKKDVIEVLTKDYKFTDGVAEKIYYKSWQDGHSEGLIRVYEEAIELAEIFE